MHVRLHANSAVFIVLLTQRLVYESDCSPGTTKPKNPCPKLCRSTFNAEAREAEYQESQFYEQRPFVSHTNQRPMAASNSNEDTASNSNEDTGLLMIVPSLPMQLESMKSGQARLDHELQVSAHMRAKGTAIAPILYDPKYLRLVFCILKGLKSSLERHREILLTAPVKIRENFSTASRQGALYVIHTSINPHQLVENILSALIACASSEDSLIQDGFSIAVWSVAQWRSVHTRGFAFTLLLAGLDPEAILLSGVWMIRESGSHVHFYAASPAPSIWNENDERRPELLGKRVERIYAILDPATGVAQWNFRASPRTTRRWKGVVRSFLASLFKAALSEQHGNNAVGNNAVVGTDVTLSEASLGTLPDPGDIPRSYTDIISGLVGSSVVVERFLLERRLPEMFESRFRVDIIQTRHESTSAINSRRELSTRHADETQ